MYAILPFSIRPLLHKNGFFTTTRPSLPKEGSCPSLNLSPHGERLNTGNRGNRRFPSVFGIAGHAMSFFGWRGDG